MRTIVSSTWGWLQKPAALIPEKQMWLGTHGQKPIASSAKYCELGRRKRGKPMALLVWVCSFNRGYDGTSRHLKRYWTWKGHGGLKQACHIPLPGFLGDYIGAWVGGPKKGSQKLKANMYLRTSCNSEWVPQPSHQSTGKRVEALRAWRSLSKSAA